MKWAHLVSKVLVTNLSLQTFLWCMLYNITEILDGIDWNLSGTSLSACCSFLCFCTHHKKMFSACVTSPKHLEDSTKTDTFTYQASSGVSGRCRTEWGWQWVKLQQAPLHAASCISTLRLCGRSPKARKGNTWSHKTKTPKGNVHIFNKKKTACTSKEEIYFPSFFFHN